MAGSQILRIHLKHIFYGPINSISTSSPSGSFIRTIPKMSNRLPSTGARKVTESVNVYDPILK